MLTLFLVLLVSLIAIAIREKVKESNVWSIGLVILGIISMLIIWRLG